MVDVMTGYRHLARNHDFTVLWVGQTVSELGSRVSMFVFPLLAYRLTGRHWWPAPPRPSTYWGWPGRCCRPGCWPTARTGAG